MLSSCDALMCSMLSMHYKLWKGYLSLVKCSLMDEELIYIYKGMCIVQRMNFYTRFN